MLPVSVAGVAVPTRTLGKYYAQQFIDDLDRVHDSRIVGRAQAEAYQSQRIRTDDLHRRRTRTASGAILNGNESLQGRRGSVFVRRRDAHVVAFHAELPGEIAVDSVGPAFDVVVPCVGHLAQKFGRLRLTHRVRQIGGDQQGRDFGGQRER